MGEEEQLRERSCKALLVAETAAVFAHLIDDLLEVGEVVALEIAEIVAHETGRSEKHAPHPALRSAHGHPLPASRGEGSRDPSPRMRGEGGRVLSVTSFRLIWGHRSYKELSQ